MSILSTHEGACRGAQTTWKSRGRGGGEGGVHTAANLAALHKRSVVQPTRLASHVQACLGQLARQLGGNGSPHGLPTLCRQPTRRHRGVPGRLAGSSVGPALWARRPTLARTLPQLQLACRHGRVVASRIMLLRTPSVLAGIIAQLARDLVPTTPRPFSLYLFLPCSITSHPSQSPPSPSCSLCKCSHAPDVRTPTTSQHNAMESCLLPTSRSSP